MHQTVYENCMKIRIRIRIPLFVPKMGTFLCHSGQRSVIFVLHGVHSQPVSLFQFLLLRLCYTARSFGVFPSSPCFSGAPVYFHKLNKTDWCTNRVSESRAPISTAQLGSERKWEAGNLQIKLIPYHTIPYESRLIQIRTAQTNFCQKGYSYRVLNPGRCVLSVSLLFHTFTEFIYKKREIEGLPGVSFLLQQCSTAARTL